MYTLDDAISDIAAGYCKGCDEFKFECAECGTTACIFCESTNCPECEMPLDVPASLY